MTEKLTSDKLYEINGVLYSLHELEGFIQSCEELARKNERQTRFIRALKLNNAQLTLERNKLNDELMEIKSMGMFEFADKYNTDIQCADAGRAFARALLGKPMTPEEVAIEDAENGYKPYNGDDF